MGDRLLAAAMPGGPEFLHYSAGPLRFDRARRYGQGDDIKPEGLWLSPGDTWARWCYERMFREEDLRCRSRVELVPGARIKVLGDPCDLARFHLRHAADSEYSRIAWEGVAARFDGIAFTPYSRAWAGVGHEWYLSLDCASVCVWNPGAIASVVPVD